MTVVLLAQNDVFAERTEAEEDVPPGFGYANPAPGETFEGAVAFQVPDGAEIAQAIRDIKDLDNVTLLDLRLERPHFDDVVPVLDNDGTQIAAVSASEPIDPYLAGDNVMFANPDNRIIGLPVSITNLGPEPYTLSTGHFGLMGTDQIVRSPEMFIFRSDEAIAAQARGIRVFGIVFEVQGWDFPTPSPPPQPTLRPTPSLSPSGPFRTAFASTSIRGSVGPMCPPGCRRRPLPPGRSLTPDASFRLPFPKQSRDLRGIRIHDRALE